MALRGIDISSHQEGINCAAIDCDFVICKATQGTYYINPDCDRAYQTAKASGKLLGVYHYATGDNVKAEADFFLANIQGYIGEAILCLDWENNPGGYNPLYKTGAPAKTWIKQWCDYIYEKTGVRPLVYGSASAYSEISGNGDYGVWVAQYPNYDPTGWQETPWNEGAYDCAIRQYTSQGYINGYAGNLDLNKAYMTREAWMKYANPSGEAVAPTPEPTPEPQPTAPSTSESITYTVQPGDTLSGIAAAYNTTYQHLADINGISNPNLIFPGQVLTISGGGTSAPQQTVYTVQPGDTLSGIAAAYHTTYQHLADINGISNPNLIYPGQQIVIK